MKSEEIIKLFDMKRLPGEGGFFCETYRSKTEVNINRLNGQAYKRISGTAIYYLITSRDFSTLHRVKHDEIFHFYMGQSAQLVQIDSEGKGLEKN